MSGTSWSGGVLRVDEALIHDLVARKDGISYGRRYGWARCVFLCREAAWESEMLVPGMMGHGTEGAAGDDVGCASPPWHVLVLATETEIPHYRRPQSSTMSGPTPSTLVLLSDLPNCAQGHKVRFLGWYVRNTCGPASAHHTKCR
jgi:hypothetical protein